MRVLISGAGIAGLTLAAFLNRHEGFNVTVVEKEQDWSHLGYTIGIWDVGRQILAKLDAADRFDDAANRLNTYELMTKHGQSLKLYHFEEFYDRYESAYSHIDRKDLHDILLHASQAEIRMDTTIEGLEEYEQQVEVSLSNGSEEVFDLVVGADGIRSNTRNLCFNTDVLEHSGRRAWYAWIDNRYVENLAATEIIGSDLICNLFDDPNSACAVFTAPADPDTHDPVDGRADRLHELFNDFCDPVPEILSGLDDEALQPTDIEFVRTDDWVSNRVVLVGDAAHAMEPFGGIGASMAMEDAYVLADELSQLHREESIDAALQRYKSRRLDRVKEARAVTRSRYWWIHDSFPGIATLRKVVAPLLPVNHFTKEYKDLLETKP